jgi:hypothetical protein
MLTYAVRFFFTFRLMEFMGDGHLSGKINVRCGHLRDNISGHLSDTISFDPKIFVDK